MAVRDDLSDPVEEVKLKVAQHLQCQVGDFRLSFGGRDLHGGSLASNGVPPQTTLLVLGNILGGSPPMPVKVNHQLWSLLVEILKLRPMAVSRVPQQ